MAYGYSAEGPSWDAVPETHHSSALTDDDVAVPEEARHASGVEAMSQMAEELIKLIRGASGTASA